MRATSPFAEEVKELCKQIIASDTEQEAIRLSRQLQKLLHERIQSLREETRSIHLVKEWKFE
jgi:hypothetical protein